MNQEEVYKIDYDAPDIPASVKELRPEVYKDGSVWHVLSGEDIANGILGSGSTPEKAMEDFDEKYARSKENSL